jgi:hypothetical protein
MTSQRSPEFDEWAQELRNQHPRKPPSTASPSAGTRETPELRHLQIATSISSSQSRFRHVRDEIARLLSAACGQEVDPDDDLEQVLKLLQKPRSRVATIPTPDGRHTIDQELQETAKMAPRTVDVHRSPGAEPPARHIDPGVVVPQTNCDQAPCTFSSTKSDRSVRSDTKYPKPTRINKTLDLSAIPRDIIRQHTGQRKVTKVYPSSNSAFSQRSENSVNCSDDYTGRVAKSE